MKSTYKKILVACLVLGIGLLVYDYVDSKILFDGVDITKFSNRQINCVSNTQKPEFRPFWPERTAIDNTIKKYVFKSRARFHPQNYNPSAKPIFAGIKLQHRYISLQFTI